MPTDSDTPRASYDEIAARMRKYAVTPMEMDLRGLSERERQLIRELLAAAELADQLFWRQTSHIALPMKAKIVSAYGEDDPIRQFYMMQAGPWDRLDHDAPFIEGTPPPRPGAAFYPEDLTADEFQRWIDQHPDDREAFLSAYTVIRREGERLLAIPYHQEYQDLVAPMAEALRRAADLAEDESFAGYLRARADGLLTDDYYDADSTWIKLSNTKFDITIGPYEVYADALLGIKAAYEASVEIVDPEESERLEIYKSLLGQLEVNLPYDDRYKSDTDLTAGFTIVRDIYRGGFLRVGYQAVACSLPNDPRVLNEVGSKKIFWKNFLEARVDQVILPISRQLVAEDQVEHVTPQGFFDVVLLHELAHAMGPKYAETREGQVPINRALKTHYTWIEEAKATAAGLVSLAFLADEGVIDHSMMREYYASYLGSIFRTIRFGTGEAHGLASLAELNYYLENGGVTHDAKSGRFAIDHEALPGSIAALARALLTIEATGDFEGAGKLKEKYGQRTPELEDALQRVADVPVDPTPVYRNIW